MSHQGWVRLAGFDNSWYDPGRGPATRALWMLVGRLFFETSVPWPSSLKAGWLRLFGARVGRGAVIKPHVRIKYPWHLELGDHCWVGEGVWVDSLAAVRLGSNVCLSQGAMIETGSHDARDPHFGLRVEAVTVSDGTWVCARALVLPGSHLGPGTVLTAGSVLRGRAEEGGPYGGIYGGNPATYLKAREARLPNNEHAEEQGRSLSDAASS